MLNNIVKTSKINLSLVLFTAIILFFPVSVFAEDITSQSDDSSKEPPKGYPSLPITAQPQQVTPPIVPLPVPPTPEIAPPVQKPPEIPEALQDIPCTQQNVTFQDPDGNNVTMPGLMVCPKEKTTICQNGFIPGNPPIACAAVSCTVTASTPSCGDEIRTRCESARASAENKCEEPVIDVQVPSTETCTTQTFDEEGRKFSSVTTTTVGSKTVQFNCGQCPRPPEPDPIPCALADVPVGSWSGGCCAEAAMVLIDCEGNRECRCTKIESAQDPDLTACSQSFFSGRIFSTTPTNPAQECPIERVCGGSCRPGTLASPDASSSNMVTVMFYAEMEQGNEDVCTSPA